jgi:coenzyme F420-reducing hydrogenase gamma subunit
MAKKPRVGIFSLTACSGCQLRILNMEDILLELTQLIDIVHFPMAKAQNEKGPFDIAFVEGAVITKENLKKLKEIRKKSKYLVALGTCAAFGGVPSMRHFLEKDELKGMLCPVVMKGALKPGPIDCHVEVDYQLRGCPVFKEEFVSALKDLLLDKKPFVYEKPVCIECRSKGNPCLLQLGQECIGPITTGGCEALCPSNNFPCTGCRGPTEDGNIEAEVKLLIEKGFTLKDIKKRIRKFAGLSKKFVKALKRIK